MPESHKKNHYIPRFMLLYWELYDGKRYGVHVYRVSERQVTFARSRGRTPFPFAIVEDLYVPVISGRRAVAMEKGWLAGLERALARFVMQAHAQEQIAVSNAMELTKLSMGILALEQRSRYNLSRIYAAIEASQEIRQGVTASPERSTHTIALENLIHVVTELYGRLSPMEFSFVHAGDEEYIISDRPAFTDTRMDERVVVLTNKVALVYKRGFDEGTFLHVDASPDFVEVVNKQVALQARDWVVARSSATLDRFAALVHGDEWEENKRTETEVALLPMHMTSGWSIPDD